MKTLWIVGAGGFGREVLSFARAAERAGANYRVGGFVDDNPLALERFELDLPVKAPIKKIAPRPDDVFAIALGTPAARLSVAAVLQGLGAEFVSVVHPAAVLSERVRIGVGCVVGPGAFLSVDAVVGDHVAIGFNAAVGHDAAIGDGSIITGCCILNGNASLGRGSFLGSHTVVLPGIKVGNAVRSTAGAIIMRDVGDGAMVGGNPARALPQAAV